MIHLRGLYGVYVSLCILQARTACCMLNMCLLLCTPPPFLNLKTWLLRVVYSIPFPYFKKTKQNKKRITTPKNQLHEQNMPCFNLAPEAFSLQAKCVSFTPGLSAHPGGGGCLPFFCGSVEGEEGSRPLTKPKRAPSCTSRENFRLTLSADGVLSSYLFATITRITKHHLGFKILGRGSRSFSTIFGEALLPSTRVSCGLGPWRGLGESLKCRLKKKQPSLHPLTTTTTPLSGAKLQSSSPRWARLGRSAGLVFPPRRGTGRPRGFALWLPKPPSPHRPPPPPLPRSLLFARRSARATAAGHAPPAVGPGLRGRPVTAARPRARRPGRRGARAGRTARAHREAAAAAAGRPGSLGGGGGGSCGARPLHHTRTHRPRQRECR